MVDRNRIDAPRGARVLGSILVLSGIGTMFYWDVFFTTGIVQVTAEPCYLVFERAFPAADAWAAISSILGGVALWRAKASAVLFTIAAGSAIVFLGLMDVLYNLEHDMYAMYTPEMATETLINVFCLTLGPAAIACAWRWRRTLDPR